MMSWRLAAASAALVLVASSAWVVSAGAAATCTALQVRNTGVTTTSVLYRLVLPEGSSTRLGALAYRLNALGYAASQGLVYGIAERSQPGPFPDGRHVMALTNNGEIRDLGPLRDDTPWHPLLAPNGSAVQGNHWLVLEGNVLYTVDIDPRSRSYLGVLSMTVIDGYWPFSVGDFDVDPVDGQLYGVSMTYRGTVAIVRLDRASGRVEELVDAPGLPPSEYGSVVIGPDRSFYVTANEAGGLYRVDRDGAVTKLAASPPMWSSDAAGCLRQSPPPPSRTTTPPSPTTPPPASKTPQLPSRTPTPSHTTSSTPPPSAPQEPPPSKPPPPEPGAYTPMTPEPAADNGGHDTKEKRRWALATLLLLIGGSAAARRLR